MLVPKAPTPGMCSGGGGIGPVAIVGGLAAAGLLAFLVLK